MARIGIVRGFMPRLTQAEFAKSFKGLNPTFITGEASREIRHYSQKVKLQHRNLSLKPLWGVDPVKLLLKKRTHQSWIGVEGLLDACRDLDVLETYELYHLFSGQAADVAEKLGIPLVCEVWTSFATHPAYFLPPYSLTAKKVLKKASLFVARSKRAANALIKLGVPKRKVKTIYHGVNLKRFHLAEVRRSGAKLRVLFVGSLEAAKGVRMLLNVWSQIFQNNPKLELWLVGSGSLLDYARGFKGVKAFGYVHHTKLPKIYRKVDMFVSPTQDRYLGPFLWFEEFFSYTLMEAQAAGLPIVATRSGGIPEEIGEGNLLIDQADDKGLLHALNDLLEDKKKREVLGKLNRKRAEKLFDLRTQTLKLEKEILELL